MTDSFQTQHLFGQIQKYKITHMNIKLAFFDMKFQFFVKFINFIANFISYISKCFCVPS